MRKATIGLFLVLMLFTINSVSGAEISVTNPRGVSIWVAPSGYSSTDPNDYTDVVAVCWNENISIFKPPTYTGGSTLIFTGLTGNEISDCVFTEDYIFFVLYNNGQVYRIPNRHGLITWSSIPSNDRVLITTVSNGICKMTIDSNGYIYVSSSNYITKINPDTLATTQSSASTYALTSLTTGTTSMYAGALNAYGTAGTPANKNYVFKYTSMSTYTFTQLIGTNWATTAGAFRRVGGFEELTNGEFLLLTSYQSITDQYSIELCNNTHTISTIDTITMTITTADFSDMIVGANGISFSSIYLADKCYTHSIGYGGIGFNDAVYVPAKLTYDTTDIYTDYQNYYNGSSVDTHYSIALDMDDQDIKFYSKDIISNRFNWKIELIDPAGVLIQSYNIPENFDRESILSNTWFITSSIRFNSITGNGTYILNLFEVDSNTNEKSLLDSTTFDILYNTNPGTTGGTTETEPGNVATNILSSVYFQAFLLIMVCALSGGSVAQGAGLGGGGLIGTVGCVMFGLLPYGFAFIIAIICCAVVALAIAEKISGG